MIIAPSWAHFLGSLGAHGQEKQCAYVYTFLGCNVYPT